MASDYANRPRKPKAPAKKGGGRRGAAAPATGLKGLIIIIGVALALILIGGFWFLKQDQQRAPASQPTSEASKTTKPAKPLPAKPKEEWAYINELENKKVGKPAPDANKGPWQMQCGSFRLKDQAESMRARIALSGIEAKVRSSEGSNGLWHRVVIGPYAQKHDAQKDMHKLAKNQVTTCQVWKWQKG